MPPEITDADLQAARDYAWARLAASPLRRSLLGRPRCDAIVRVAMNSRPPESELAYAGNSTAARKMLCDYVARRVRANYSEVCGFAFTTMILIWAISSIVQALVARWISNHMGQQP